MAPGERELGKAVTEHDGRPFAGDVDRQIDGLDRGAVPRRLEEVVGEAEVEDALEHLLGKIVVYAVDLLLAKE